MTGIQHRFICDDFRRHTYVHMCLMSLVAELLWHCVSRKGVQCRLEETTRAEVSKEFFLGKIQDSLTVCIMNIVSDDL